MSFQDKWVPQCGKCTCSSCSGTQFFSSNYRCPCILRLQPTAYAQCTRDRREGRPTVDFKVRFFLGNFLACNFVFLVMGPFEGWSKDSVIGLFLGLLALLAFIAFLFNKLCRFLQFYFDEKCLRPSCKCHECLTSRDT